jgi:hypothetical protein
MASSPSFIGTPRLGVVNVSAANTNRDGTGTITEVLAGVTAGTRVLEVKAKVAAGFSDAVVNIFLSTDSGATWRLFDAIPVIIQAADTITDSYEASALYDNLILAGAGYRLGVTTTIAQSTNVFAMGGDL